MGIVIGKIVEPFRKSIDTNHSLKNAGTYIGIFERSLILIFILVHQFAAVGFLLASKSILKIRERSLMKKEEKDGICSGWDFIEFLSAIIIGLITSYLINKSK